MHIGQFSLVICSFVLAVAGYFIWPHEPSLLPAISILSIAAVSFIASRYIAPQNCRRVGLVLLAVLIGFAWAQMRSHMQAQNGKAPIGELQIYGSVEWHEAQARGSRWDVRVQDGDNNYVLRLYGKRSHLELAAPGCYIMLTAEISSLPGPIVLGGYDPRRDAWFTGRRGQGFIRSIDDVDCTVPIEWRHNLARARLALARHYRANMSDEAGPVAAALVTGVRGAIARSVRDASRHSGLAHMLAISGLHMALFASSVYALLRLLAAMIPRLVLHHDLRKPSAMISLAAATGYLFLSGAGVATQRAYIMLAIFFLAILLDRPAITMRNVLWAALLVLVWQPHAVMQAGFQMSFSAVMALVAVYEAWRQRDTLYVRWERMSLLQQIMRRFWRYASALFMTSLIAGSVTGFIAIVRFQQVGTFGLPANLLAMPLFGTLIMPMAPLSLWLMPVGFETPVLVLMESGIENVLAVAGYFTAMSGALWRPGASAAYVMPLATLGFGIICLLNSRWRLFGLLPITLALTGIGQGERPALHMFGRKLIAARTDDALLVLRQRGHQYELDRLARHHGLVPKEISCRPHCRLTLKGGIEFAYHDRLGGLTQSCRSADVIVMPFAEARYPSRAQLFDSPAFTKRVHRQFTDEGGQLYRQRISKNRLWQRD
ncbi:MAG: ComE operon protein 3 [Alphaproteobacteria bacterium]|nr:MAG: ComE operon protein 3 [Alphaproteobacteria bacterium]